MSPKDKPTFYLYSIGYSPRKLTLGTLIYNNYAVPDNRFITFPQLSDEELSKQDFVTVATVSGSFTNSSDRKYGFGIEAIQLAATDIEVARSKNTIVTARSGRRITLDDAEGFFLDRVIQNDKIKQRLAVWLSVSKSGYLWKKATLQKPKIYCVTGVYQLTDVIGKTNDGHSGTFKFGVSDTIVAAATGIPLGATVGPFEGSSTLEANISMPETAVWAARFHQLDVEFIKIATRNEPPTLPCLVNLYPDVTFVHGIRHSPQKADDDSAKTKTIPWPEVVDELEVMLDANAAILSISEPAEMEPDEEAEGAEASQEYWKAFNEAEKRVTRGVVNAEAAQAAKTSKVAG